MKLKAYVPFVLLVLSACQQKTTTPIKVDTDPWNELVVGEQKGRYQMTHDNNYMFIFDTATARVWAWNSSNRVFNYIGRPETGGTNDLFVQFQAWKAAQK